MHIKRKLRLGTAARQNMSPISASTRTRFKESRSKPHKRVCQSCRCCDHAGNHHLTLGQTHLEYSELGSSRPRADAKPQSRCKDSRFQASVVKSWSDQVTSDSKLNHERARREICSRVQALRKKPSHPTAGHLIALLTLSSRPGRSGSMRSSSSSRSLSWTAIALVSAGFVPL